MGIEFDAQSKALSMIHKIIHSADLSNYFLDRCRAFEQIDEICKAFIGKGNIKIVEEFLKDDKDKYCKECYEKIENAKNGELVPICGKCTKNVHPNKSFSKSFILPRIKKDWNPIPGCCLPE